MDCKIKISVIINTYNYANYIGSAISSVLNQSCPRSCFEVIVVDDGSTDETRERVAGFLPEVTYLYKENGGQASAINAGLEVAKGKYVSFLDADDYWDEMKLEEVLACFEENLTVDVVYHSLVLVDGDNQNRGVIPYAGDSSIAGKPVDNDLQRMASIGGATSGISWRRSALSKLLPIPDAYRLCADSYLMVCAPFAAKRFVLIDKTLGFYRIHGSNQFSDFVYSSSFITAKSANLAAHYRNLCLGDMVRLSSELNCNSVGMIKSLSAICFADELMSVRHLSGRLPAIRKLFNFSVELTNLPVKIRCYRRAVILLRILLPCGLFSYLQGRCVNSFLWLFVQKYVKNDSRLFSFGSDSEFAPDKLFPNCQPK